MLHIQAKKVRLYHAGIQPRWIWTPLADSCGPEVVQWVTRFKFHASEGRAGLVLHGEQKNFIPEAACAAIAGALTRNFIRARVSTLNEVLLATQEGEPPMMSCLLIPNFFVAGQKPGAQHQWRTALALDALTTRAAAGLQTVLYVSSLPGLANDYGPAVRRHLDALYKLQEVC